MWHISNYWNFVSWAMSRMNCCNMILLFSMVRIVNVLRSSMRLLMNNSMAVMMSFGDLVTMGRSMTMLDTLMTSFVSNC